ncbi:amidase [Streptomyces diastatochromogenes]|uniref:Amidase domain-containing protein n=1 Tax=Streptomyces diastatochromogenes TaxID=42236 RepID=A0A233SY32_STRDA|nr:amidase [Streptomyces diastatochromogenes]MCZ0991728.1 amidase [Streptomyces diastatochromogenes]OXZ00557.1 hypothetical protein BEK98_00355 [Streptomyces diastatochromogenes]
MSEELWHWSAERTARCIKNGEISAVEAVTAALARLEATNHVSNAFGEVAEDALDKAQQTDAAIARGDAVGPLSGVPVAFKLNTDVKGQPTPDGVADYLRHPAPETAPVLSNLQAAGAISVGRTNVPSFSFRWCTESEHWGRTRNPWDSGVTPGGSSGGAAVAVATGVVPIAHGNDIAGSIRYPAAVCGVVGLRPTVGRVPVWHAPPGSGMPLSYAGFAVEGPIARTVGDVRLALRVMQAPDPRDPIAVPFDAPRYDAGQAPKRVAIVTDPGRHSFAGPGRPETDDAVRVAGRWLAEAGYEVEEVSLPLLGEAASLWWKLVLTEMQVLGLTSEVHRVQEAQIGRFFQLLTEAAADAFGEVSFAEFVGGWSRRHLLRRQLSEFMAKFPILLVPNSGEPAFAHGEDLVSVDRCRELLSHQWANTAAPLLGLPGLGIGAVRDGGAPLGVQLIGRAFDEESLLQAAEVIERRSGLTTPIDPAPRG